MHAALQAVVWLLALTWLGKLLSTIRGLRKIEDISHEAFDSEPAGTPHVAVIVPARNEAAKVAACLASLVGQDYAALQVLAVDDRSTDATGAIMDSFAQQTPARLRAIHIAELPPGWLGKTHAMAQAARLAPAADYLLFTDADIVFHPQVVRRAVAAAVSMQADHFVAMPTTLVRSFGEGMLLSYLHVMGLWAVRPWRVSDPAARDAVGVGAFNLLRADAYRALGGFDALRMEIVEDLALARRVKKARMRQRVVRAPGMVEVHWAAGLSGVVNGMTKNLFAVFCFRVWRLVLAAASLVGLCVAPYVLLATPGMRLPGAIAVASILGMGAVSGHYSGVSRWYGVLFPLSALIFVYSLGQSAAITLARGGVTWRGTFYPLRELKR